MTNSSYLSVTGGKHSLVSEVCFIPDRLEHGLTTDTIAQRLLRLFTTRRTRMSRGCAEPLDSSTMMDWSSGSLIYQCTHPAHGIAQRIACCIRAAPAALRP